MNTSLLIIIAVSMLGGMLLGCIFVFFIMLKENIKLSKEITKFRRLYQDLSDLYFELKRRN